MMADKNYIIEDLIYDAAIYDELSISTLDINRKLSIPSKFRKLSAMRKFDKFTTPNSTDITQEKSKIQTIRT